MPIRVALGLPVAEYLIGSSSDPLSGGRSWFGGRPAVPETARDWEHPSRSDGRHLDHIVQVDLATEAGNQGGDTLDAIGLPGDGVIQVFHDVETFGWEASDDHTAWRVVWHPTPPAADVELIIPAEDGGHSAATPTYPINAQAMATAPSPVGFETSDDAEWQRYENAVLSLEQSAYEMNMMASTPRGDQTPWDPDYTPPPPVSRMGGYGHAETNQELVDLLNDTLPLRAEQDGHYLLFDINPRAITDSDELINWFHGGRHLEVWIRKSDLDARVFEHVWCVIRTDN